MDDYNKLIKAMNLKPSSEIYSDRLKEINNKNERNAAFEEYMQNIFKNYGDSIVKAESELHNSYISFAELLVSQLTKKSFSKNDRHEIKSWINELLEEELGEVDNPKVVELKEKFSQALVAVSEQQKGEGSDSYREKLEYMLGQVEDQTGISPEEIFSEEELEQMYNDPEAYLSENIDVFKNKLIEAIENVESMDDDDNLDVIEFEDTIYFKLYEILVKEHNPDLTNDDEGKAKRNALLNKLKEAKNNNDFYSIVHTYNNHFEEVDRIEFTESDFEDLIRMLRRKSFDLDNEFDDMQMSTPLGEYIVYEDIDINGTEISDIVDGYIDELKEFKEKTEERISNARTVKSLKVLLEERREEAESDDLDDMMSDLMGYSDFGDDF